MTEEHLSPKSFMSTLHKFCLAFASFTILLISSESMSLHDKPNNQQTKQVEVVMTRTKLSFVTVDTASPFTRRTPDGKDTPFEGIKWDEAEVEIHNGRLHHLLFDKNGFQLVQNSIPENLDFFDLSDIVNNYYPICRDLLANHLGNGVKVYPFDHNVRSNVIKCAASTKYEQTVLEPIRIVHADYTAVSAPKRLEQLAQAPKINDIHSRFLKEHETLLDPQLVQQILLGKRRFVFANVWRSIDKQAPVQQHPLACMDAQSLENDQLRTFSIYYEDRVGQNYFLTNHSQQRWFYFPLMTHDEAILLKQWDSSGDFALTKGSKHLSTFSAHSAFIDPNSPQDAPPRESIEVRCVVIYPENS
jgi:hypothetical protein